MSIEDKIKEMSNKIRDKAAASIPAMIERSKARAGTLSINEILLDAYATEVSKGWHDGDPEEKKSLPIFVALVHSEVSECLEAYRERGFDEWREPVDYNPDGKPCGVASELADTIIRIAAYCAHMKIDLDTALRVKLEFNKSRPHRHGGKRV